MESSYFSSSHCTQLWFDTLSHEEMANVKESSKRQYSQFFSSSIEPNYPLAQEVLFVATEDKPPNA
jgi:hypothetical protein